MTTTTNTLSGPETGAQQPGNRPVVETLEKYRSEILNTISSSSGTSRTSAQNSIEFLNSLNSLVAPNASNATFTTLLRNIGIPNYGNVIAQLRRDVAGNTPTITFADLPGHNDVQFIITALAEFRRHQAQEQQHQFDAIYLGQTGQTESSTAQQIEAAATRARLSGGALYYRNKVPLRISWNNTANQFEAQYLDQNGQPTNLQGITAPDIPTLVTEINTRSQRIQKITSDNVQENVENRESKKADHKQIIAAIDFVNRGQDAQAREARTGFYSIDNRNIAIRGEGVGAFSVDIIQPDGSIVTRNGVAQNTITQMIDAACAAYEKSKERKETVEAVDMGNQFSEASFRKLCRDISGSKDKVGEYTLSGQKYTIREITAAVPATPQNGNNPAVQGTPALYWAQFPNPQGRTVSYPPLLPNNANPPTGVTVENLTAQIARNSRTSTNAGNCTRDMGNEFSENTFRELCEEIAEAKNGRGTYTLAGKKYEVRVDQPLPVDIQQAQFNVEYPNQFGIKVHTHGTIDTLLDTANHGPLSHIHVHDPSKPAPFERQTMLDLCNLAWNNPGRHPFDFHGATCHVYRGSGLDKGIYCVDVPNTKGGVDTIKAITAKGLYKKFIDHTHKLHHEAEHAKKGGEHAAEGGHKDAGHGDHGHDKDGGHDKKEGHESHGFFDTAVHKIFGHGGLFGGIGSALIWGKNQVPEGVRKFGGGVADTAWKSAITGGVIVGGTALIPGITFAAAAAGFWPITLTSGAVIGGRKLYKWWKGGDEGGGHGAHH